jgi:hypothetical protein
VISCLFHILKKYSFSQVTLSVSLSFIYYVHVQEQPPEVVHDIMAEDQDFLNQTITQFGPPFRHEYTNEWSTRTIYFKVIQVHEKNSSFHSIEMFLDCEQSPTTSATTAVMRKRN